MGVDATKAGILPSRGNSGFMEESSSEVVTNALPEPEKTFSQSQLDEIVKREKAQAKATAAERTRAEMKALHEEELQKLKASQPKSEGPKDQKEEVADEVFQRVLKHAEKLDEEEKLRAEKEQEAEREEGLKKLASDYIMKMELGKSKFSDFDEVMKDFDPRGFPQLSLLAGQMENTAEIMYELANNPSKLAQLNMLVERSPALARKEMSKLAESIVQNQQALASNVTASPPLSRPKSSTVGADSGKMTLKDLKNEPWLRG